MTLRNKIDFYEGKIPGCFPAEEWVFRDVKSVASENRGSLRGLARKVWEDDSVEYDFRAILLADVRELKIDGRIFYYGSSIGCSPRLL